MGRPDDLPDFGKPPIDEVLLSIQFSPPANYQQIYAGEVWGLFKDRFPIVQEQPPIAPVFETFGSLGVQQPNMNFIVGALHDRFWFLSSAGDQLIQFQNDRLIHNWRKNKPNETYPRYESIVAQFEEEASLLESFFEKLGGSLAINQCEISYINHLLNEDSNAPLKATDWLLLASPLADSFSDFRAFFRRQIDDEQGEPIGRLSCEAGHSVRRDGKPSLSLSITARGKPNTPTLQSALDFIGAGREMIVRLFAEITTDSAHKLWERNK